MKIKALKLTNFRNHGKLSFEFDEKPALITGPNGSGKSNVLEAIHLLATTKTLRAKYDKEVISHDEKFTRIEVVVNLDGYDYALELMVIKNEKYANMSSKKAKINGVAKSLSNFTGTINTVLFTPSDIEIFTSAPSQRRKYIDQLFFQVDKEYKREHANYVKAVRRRNKILEKIRDEGKGQDELGFWDDKIIDTGTVIQNKREKLFAFLEKKLPKYGEELNGEKTKYHVSYLKNEISAKRIEQYKEKEIAAKATLVGPHRDDFGIKLAGFDIASFGSRGQKRATLLAMKLCEIDFIWDQTGKRPILLLDDIFSELDNNHKEAILKIIDLQQTIITSAEPVEQLKEFIDGMKLFRL